MSFRNLTGRSIAALAGVAILAVTLSPAEALTLPGPSLAPPVAEAQIDKAFWRHGGGWGRGRGFGWGAGALVGGLAAGALIGSYYGPGYYGYGPGYYYGPGYDPCLRRVWGPWGWRWARVC